MEILGWYRDVSGIDDAEVGDYVQVRGGGIDPNIRIGPELYKVVGEPARLLLAREGQVIGVPLTVLLLRTAPVRLVLGRELHERQRQEALRAKGG